MSSDRFAAGIESATAIGATPTTFVEVQRGVYMGVSGDLTFTLESGDSVQLVGMAAGVWHPMRFTAITAVATATGIVVGR